MKISMKSSYHNSLSLSAVGWNIHIHSGRVNVLFQKAHCAIQLVSSGVGVPLAGPGWSPQASITPWFKSMGQNKCYLNDEKKPMSDPRQIKGGDIVYFVKGREFLAFKFEFLVGR